MPVTLAQAQVNAATDVDYNVIDNLRRYGGWLLDRIAFDDTVTPPASGPSTRNTRRARPPACPSP